MNEEVKTLDNRVKGYVEQLGFAVGEEVDPNQLSNWWAAGHGNRFQDLAKMIVKECCEVAHCNFHVDGITLGNLIKQHFGIEE